MDKLTRPQPVGATERGHAIYNSREVAAWRASRGVTQDAVADHLHVARPYIARLESGKTPLQEKQAIQIMTATEYLAMKREKVIADGLAELATIRGIPKVTRVKAGTR